MGRTLALIGGGHAHVELLRQLAERPIADLDVALFDPNPSSWYAPMLPGVIAGHYSPSQARFNLWALCQKARVRFFETAVTRIDAANQRIYTALGERHFYDVLSLNIGSQTRPLEVVEGAYAVSVKPTDAFLEMVEERSAIASSGMRLAVIGGGARGVETILALAWRWRERGHQLTLATESRLLPRHPERARTLALKACDRLGVHVLEGVRVQRIEPGNLRFADGRTLPTHVSVLATGFAPQALLRHCDLKLTRDGAVAINGHLQSASHVNVFAVGDCATAPGTPAVKDAFTSIAQGKQLRLTLDAFAQNKPLPSYAQTGPRIDFLCLGERRAIAIRKGLALHGGWAWQWKDREDRRRMALYGV